MHWQLLQTVSEHPHLSSLPFRVLLRYALVDIATEYAFGWSYNRLGKPDFDPSFHDACVAGLASAALMVQMPWIMKALKSMPEWLAIKLNPSYAQYILEQKVITPSML
jgi:hypothetical protein